MRAALVVVVLVSAPGWAQERPDEASLFGGDDEVVPDGGPGEGTPPGAVTVPPLPDGGVDRDQAQLGGPAAVSRFDTGEEVDNPLKVGATLNVFGQGFWQEERPFEKATFSAPFILDAYIDGRPNDRLRAFAVGRLQYDPTRPAGDSSTATTVASTGTASLVGLTPTQRSNPSVLLDQLWLRFDIARVVYVTVGRQKVRWGVSRVWFPTDFLNSQPRDALNPFDIRLGVNMVKFHLPVESLGWNFYAYGLLDAVTVGSAGITLDQVGGAVRAELVLGPAEVGLGGVWQLGRRPRYAVDVSTPLGPVDVYAEAAFRDARDFTLFRYPADLSADNLIQNLGNIEAYRPEGLLVQVSGGVTYAFNYTDRNSAILSAEYFYNPAGYTDPIGYQVSTFAPTLLGVRRDPIQSVALYQGQHNLALTAAVPGLPGADWITLSLANIVIINDPAALTRVDAIFRVLQFLSVQAFAGVLYGQAGGQLRFRLTTQAINDIATLSDAQQPGSGDQVRASLSSLRFAPILQAGLILRLSI